MTVISKDFAFLAQHVRFQHYLLCRSESPWPTYDELIAYVRKNPKVIKYGSSGVSASQHIMMEYWAMKENLQWIHIPYNSQAESVTALLGGHLDLAASTLNTEIEFVKTAVSRPSLFEQQTDASPPGSFDSLGEGL